MANGQAWLNTTHIRLRDHCIAYGHVMPIGLMPQSNIGALVGVIVFSAQGCAAVRMIGVPVRVARYTRRNVQVMCLGTSAKEIHPWLSNT